MTKTVHPDIVDLANRIDAAATLLRSFGEQPWSSWLAKDAATIRNLNLRGVEHFLGAFGGMGSINDLVICPVNGHKITEQQVDAANNELRSMLSEAAVLARKLYAEESGVKRGA
ncbi:hypothetical protein IP90_03274 [Luteimonas cucumeris]|uniref:DUF6966 domain-containing protein n=1 Tax=Luteimonas cucumeris TaxID=985012 RepID=A0A562KU58_9GAMM|nr:hypothetical protein [Luteimonas cucumeris]TWH98876.1 hypothetical protein IP90_03274 [Luteimonas cucumeris]